MATDIYGNKDSNVRKTWGLMLGFLVVVILLGWAFSYILDSQLILYIAIAIAIIMNIASYWYSDKLVIKTTGAKEADPNTYRELHNIVENLAITAGLPKPRVYIMQDPAPNAFATGRNPEHAAVAVTTGLLEILNKAELEGVMAHELSHVGNRDILVSTVVVVLVGFVTLLSDFFLRSLLFGGVGGDSKDGRLQLILILIGVVLAILSPIVATIIKLAVSRKREFLADSSGALLTRYPDGLASALKKISANAGQMQKANHATAHLFIANPFSGAKAKGFMNKLFLTHPPVEERVSALLGDRE